MKSMQGIRRKLNTGEAIQNIAEVCGIELEEIPHCDTVNNISEIKDSLVDSLRNTIAQNATLPAMQLAGLNIATAVMDYGDLFIVSLGSFKALIQKEEILYLNAYKHLLEAKASGDALSILTAELNCDAIDINSLPIANIERSKKFAEYIFNIEYTLPV